MPLLDEMCDDPRPVRVHTSHPVIHRRSNVFNVTCFANKIHDFFRFEASDRKAIFTKNRNMISTEELKDLIDRLAALRRHL